MESNVSKKNNNLESQLWLVRRGVTDFASFVRQTRAEFRAMAGYLLRRWRAPESLTPEDLEQELYLGAWKHLWRYEPEYAAHFGTTLEQYVTFNAITDAKRELHKARGVKLSGSPDKVPSCIARPLSRIREGEALAEMILREEPGQERAMILREDRAEAFHRALDACECPRERIAVLTIAEVDDVDAAGRALYDDADARRALCLGNEDAAIRFVAQHAVRVAARLDPSFAEEFQGGLS